MAPISFPPLARAECGLAGELGFDPTTYGTFLTVKMRRMSGRGFLRTRHWVVAEEVIHLTSCKTLGDLVRQE
jgi:hypothetical protein